MEPQFPLPAAPACKVCRRPCTRQTVLARNRNGNPGRPYYTCKSSEHRRTFSTWDDREGIVNGNPRCWCGSTSRRGTTNGPAPTDFYSCPAGRCTWSEDAPLAPGANRAAIVGWAPRHPEPRPEVEMEAQNVEMEAQGVEMEAQDVEIKPAYRERRRFCCVVM